MGLVIFNICGLDFLRLGVSTSYVWGLLFLRLGVSKFYVWGLDFLRFWVSNSNVSFLLFGG